MWRRNSAWLLYSQHEVPTLEDGDDIRQEMALLMLERGYRSGRGLLRAAKGEWWRKQFDLRLGEGFEKFQLLSLIREAEDGA